jgi:hypothetical protein
VELIKLRQKPAMLLKLLLGTTTLNNKKATLGIMTFNAYVKYCYAEHHTEVITLSVIMLNVLAPVLQMTLGPMFVER